MPSMPENPTRFQQYLDAANLNTADVADALAFLATCHPVFKNNNTLNDILCGKTQDISGTDLSAITKAALSHAISISKKALTLAPHQQLSVAAEINVLNAAVAYLDCVRFQMLQDAITALSEVDRVRKYSQGKL